MPAASRGSNPVRAAGPPVLIHGIPVAVVEEEPGALRRYLRMEPQRASCALARVEVIRAVQPPGTAATRRARLLLRRVDLVLLDDELLDAAAMLDAGILRSLDGINLAAAQTLGDDLTAVVTYDDRMAARQPGWAWPSLLHAEMSVQEVRPPQPFACDLVGGARLRGGARRRSIGPPADRTVTRRLKSARYTR